MKTIIISTSYFGNPVSDYYKELGSEFVKNGYKVIYIFDGLLKEIPKNTENFNYYTWPSTRPTKFADFVFLGKLIKRHKPILSISNFGSAIVMSIISYLFRVKNRIEYIHTTTTQREIDNKNKFRIKLFRFRKKLVYKLNTHFFTNSEGTKLNSIKKFGIEKEKITVLPLLINSSDLDLCKRERRENTLIIVGRLHPSKGHEGLLIQFSKCLSDFPELKLKIVGSGYLRERLEKLCNELHINDSVVFTGNIANQKINVEFSKALASVSSSKEEAFGLVNIEALREGTPLICTKTAGSGDILIENYNGVFYDNSHENSLKEAIHTILSDWETYSKNARTAFSNKYGFEKNISKQFNIINQLIRE